MSLLACSPWIAWSASIEHAQEHPQPDPKHVSTSYAEEGIPYLIGLVREDVEEKKAERWKEIVRQRQLAGSRTT